MGVIRLGEPGDAPAIAELLEARDGFYGSANVSPLGEREAQIRSFLFGPAPVASVILACDEAQVVGLASYSFLWPATGATHSIYLKELFVAQAARSQGFGQLLMRRLVEIASEQGCSRIEWTTDRDNDSAQAFYEQLGFQVHESKLFYRLSL